MPYRQYSYFCNTNLFCEVHEHEQSPNPPEEWDGEHDGEVEVGLVGAHVASVQVVADCQGGHHE